MKAGWGRAIFVLVLCGFSCAGAWIVHLSRGDFALRTQDTLSEVYTDALASGQASLKILPDPHLLQVADPWSPALAQYHVLDVSYYRGRYFLYFGVTPFLLLLVPWFKLTGAFLSNAAAIWIFCGAGYIAYGLALFRAWRRWFAEVSPWTFGLALLGLGVASGAGSLLARQNVYELVSAAGYACFAWAAACAVAAETSPARANRWRAGACLAAALAIGCRPNYAPAVAILVAWVAWRAWSGGEGPRTGFRRMGGALLPLVIVAIFLAALNFHRFGSPTEFGFRYQVGNSDRRASALLHLQNLPYNLHRYLLGRPRLSGYFPFIDGEVPGPIRLPATHLELTDEVYGCLWLYPVALFAGFILCRRREAGPRIIWRLCAVLALAALGNLLLLSAFGNGCYRYPIDFLGPWALVASVGLLSAGSLRPGLLRRGAILLFLPLLGWSAAAALCQTISISEHYYSFSASRPEDFRTVARPFNALVYLFERAAGGGPRGLRLTVRFPAGRLDQVEPLVVTGPEGRQDFLYVRYITPKLIQVGLQSAGHGGPESGFADADFSQPHTFELDYGSFLPPDDHPLVRNLAPADRQLARRMITVLLDDKPVLDGWADFNPPHGQFFIGESPFSGAYGAKFTGQIIKVERPLLPVFPSPSRWQTAAYGPLSLRLGLVPLPLGISEPIVSFGHRHQGGIIVLERLSTEEARFGWIDSDLHQEWSQPFTWSESPPRQLHRVDVAIGSLLPPVASSLWPARIPEAARVEAKATLQVRVDGALLWSLRGKFPDVAPSTVVVGKDQLFILPRVMPAFSGELASAARQPW